MKDCYQNKESKEIEKTLNDARKELGLEDFLPPVEVWFTKGKPSVQIQSREGTQK